MRANVLITCLVTTLGAAACSPSGTGRFTIANAIEHQDCFDVAFPFEPYFLTARSRTDSTGIFLQSKGGSFQFVDVIAFEVFEPDSIETGHPYPLEPIATRDSRVVGSLELGESCPDLMDPLALEGTLDEEKVRRATNNALVGNAEIIAGQHGHEIPRLGRCPRAGDRGFDVPPAGSANVEPGHGVRVWDVATGTQLLELFHDDAITTVAFDRAGSVLATYGMARGWVDFWLIWILVDVVGVRVEPDALELDRAGGAHHVADRPQGGGLAGAVTAEQRHDLALRHRQRQAAQHEDDVVVDDLDVVEAQHGRAGPGGGGKSRPCRGRSCCGGHGVAPASTSTIWPPSAM